MVTAAGDTTPTPLGATPFRRLLMVLDGHAMVFRAWFALARQPMTLRNSPEDVRGAYGFTSTLFKAVNDLRPTHIIIAFDPPGPTFRDAISAQYKAHRPPTPPDIHHNVERVKQLARALHIPTIEVPGYEADDVIGTIASEASEKGIDTIIFTGDTDTLQLVSPHVRVLITSGFSEQRLYDEQAVRERYGGLKPVQQIDVKALEGDASDNIPGVPGVGRKTAVRLVQDYGSLEEIYAHLSEVVPLRVQGLLREHEQQARECKYLVTIATDAPVAFDIEQAQFGSYSRQEVFDVLRSLEFASLIPRVPIGERTATSTISLPSASDFPPTETTTVDTGERFETLRRELRAAPLVVFDTYPTSSDPMSADLIGLAFSIAAGKAFYVPLGHSEGCQLPASLLLPDIIRLLEDDAVGKVGHNLNFDLTLLANHGIRPHRVRVTFDTMLAAHMLGDRQLGLQAQVFSRLGFELRPPSELTDSRRKQKPLDAVSIPDTAGYCGGCVDMTLRLMELQRADLGREGLIGLMDQHELPLLPVIVQMQVDGIGLDLQVLEPLARELDDRIGEAEAAAYDAVGHRFAIGSPKQLSDLLFEELKLPKGKRRQTGYSTDAATLEGLRHLHPVVQCIQEYREVSKLKSTYVDTLPDMVNPQTGRIHTSYNQAGSATGRFSSNDPNLQNIPIRSDLGRRIRKAFVPRDDWLLLAADYSQVELRVLAHLSGDGHLLAAFQRDEDIHSATAAVIYKVPIGEVTSDMRRLAKVLNFGVIYGLSAFGISQQTELTVDEGAEFIAAYFNGYPRVKEYLDQTIASAKRDGYVETVLGRRRYLPELGSSSYSVRQAGERMAVNMPVQGTAAEVIREAMVIVQRRLIEEEWRAKMLLQVHDELVFETPPDELEPLKALLYETMPHALRLEIPLKVDLKVGRTWGDMEQVP